MSTPKFVFPKLDPADAFLHVIYDYRYLAVAGCAWNTIGPSGTAKAQKSANAVIPGVGVLVQDSLLMHARSLIDFYTKSGADPTDIVLADFGLTPTPAGRKAKLERYKPPIEVHLLHLTAYRDVTYRNRYKTQPRAAARFRPDWNKHNAKLVAVLVEALKQAGYRRSAWQEPFQELYLATSTRLTDPAVDFPPYLLEAKDVRRYLKGLGLAT